MHRLYGLPKLIFVESTTHNFIYKDSTHQLNFELIVIKVKIYILLLE